jgi:hypothetical protein
MIYTNKLMHLYCPHYSWLTPTFLTIKWLTGVDLAKDNAKTEFEWWLGDPGEGNNDYHYFYCSQNMCKYDSSSQAQVQLHGHLPTLAMLDTATYHLPILPP